MKIMSGKPEVVFVLGKPGSGKGTQSSKISQVRYHQLQQDKILTRVILFI